LAVHRLRVRFRLCFALSWSSYVCHESP
jgi:hypothetical protein